MDYILFDSLIVQQINFLIIFKITKDLKKIKLFVVYCYKGLMYYSVNQT